MQRDFEPVSMISRSSVALAVAVAANFPANTLEEFVTLVKKNPGRYSYASFGQGTSANIFGETLNQVAKLDLVHVPYKGAAPMVTDLLGNQVSCAILDTATLRPLAQAGKVKVLAMAGTQRASVFPNVPTFAELGYTGFEPVGFFMMLAPAGTPRDIVRKLSDGIGRAIRSDDLRAAFLISGRSRWAARPINWPRASRPTVRPSCGPSAPPTSRSNKASERRLDRAHAHAHRATGPSAHRRSVGGGLGPDGRGPAGRPGRPGGQGRDPAGQPDAPHRPGQG